MRYFIFSYSGFLYKNRIEGEFSCICDGFPSRKHIVEKLKEYRKNLEDVIILNIFEFKNEEDYNNFIN
jgi:hypothetical protein